MSTRKYIETVIVGGGQTGLTAGYYLAKRGRPFVILDANERIGDAWRNRWDSLRLFTPALFSRLPGLPLDMPRWSFPTKDELADYLESYAAHFELPVRTGVEVERLAKADGRFVVSAGDDSFEAENVIVATGAHNIPKTPAFAAELEQLHSAAYRNPSQLQEATSCSSVRATPEQSSPSSFAARVASCWRGRRSARSRSSTERCGSGPAFACSASSGTECSSAATRSAGRSA
jgi:cation diffusion facilitator CzcD-associated flavoprotein CzcO